MGFNLNKRLSLEFLGPDHAEDYLLIKPVAMGEYKGLLAGAKEAGKDPIKDMDFMANHVKERLVEGKVGGVAVTKENILELPSEVFVEAFDAIIGRVSPKPDRP